MRAEVMNGNERTPTDCLLRNEKGDAGEEVRREKVEESELVKRCRGGGTVAVGEWKRRRR